MCLAIFLFCTHKPQQVPAGGYRSSVSCHSYFDCCRVHNALFLVLQSIFHHGWQTKDRDNPQACIKYRND